MVYEYWIFSIVEVKIHILLRLDFFLCQEGEWQCVFCSINHTLVIGVDRCQTCRTEILARSEVFHVIGRLVGIDGIGGTCGLKLPYSGERLVVVAHHRIAVSVGGICHHILTSVAGMTYFKDNL